MGHLTVPPTSAPGSFKQIGVWQSRYSPCEWRTNCKSKWNSCLTEIHSDAISLYSAILSFTQFFHFFDPLTDQKVKLPYKRQLFSKKFYLLNTRQIL